MEILNLIIKQVYFDQIIAGTKKIETSIDEPTCTKILAYKRHEKKLFPLRISSSITILVPKNKCNQEYAEEYLRKYSQVE